MKNYAASISLYAFWRNWSTWSTVLLSMRLRMNSEAQPLSATMVAVRSCRWGPCGASGPRRCGHCGGTQTRSKRSHCGWGTHPWKPRIRFENPSGFGGFVTGVSEGQFWVCKSRQGHIRHSTLNVKRYLTPLHEGGRSNLQNKRGDECNMSKSEGH